MELHLVQHGLALSEQEDPARPLSEAGRAAVVSVARHAGAAGIDLGAIRHSGKLRAAQTAEILANHASHTGAPEELPGLAPRDDPAPLAARLAAMGPALTLVGHLPSLSRLASLLLCGDPERELLAFRNAGIVRLARRGEAWVVVWAITPELAGA